MKIGNRFDDPAIRNPLPARDFPLFFCVLLPGSTGQSHSLEPQDLSFAGTQAAALDADAGILCANGKVGPSQFRRFLKAIRSLMMPKSALVASACLPVCLR